MWIRGVLALIFFHFKHCLVSNPCRLEIWLWKSVVCSYSTWRAAAVVSLYSQQLHQILMATQFHIHRKLSNHVCCISTVYQYAQVPNNFQQELAEYDASVSILTHNLTQFASYCMQWCVRITVHESCSYSGQENCLVLANSTQESL